MSASALLQRYARALDDFDFQTVIGLFADDAEYRVQMRANFERYFAPTVAAEIGDHVRKGQVVVRIDPVFFSIEVMFATTGLLENEVSAEQYE